MARLAKRSNRPSLLARRAYLRPERGGPPIMKGKPMSENSRRRPDRYDAFEKAREDELIFTLLERDPCAPPTIMHWVDLRRKAALEIGDEEARHAELSQITNAEMIAIDMIARQKGHGEVKEGRAMYDGSVAERNELDEALGQLRSAMAEADYHAHEALDAITRAINLDAANAHPHIDEQMRRVIKSLGEGIHEIAMRLSQKRAMAGAEIELPLDS